MFLCNNGRLDEAETVLTAANNPFYESPEIALTNAGLCVYKSKPEDGERYFKQALTKNPGFAHALIQMADIFYNRSKVAMISIAS
ncbi:MAG: hypothetical protein O7D86_13475 [Proteobacteria bacterium]|nr:hypothetical protein [Pseudomonadota bacterium]